MFVSRAISKSLVSLPIIVSAILLSLVFTNTAHAATYNVTNTTDSGAGSLRQAITDANANAGADTILFNIPGAGPHTITPLTELPVITSPTDFDAITAQAGASCGTLVPATLPAPNNTPHNLRIVLDGSNLTATKGLLPFYGWSSGSSVRGISFVNAGGGNSFYTKAIFIWGGSSDYATDYTIECNYFGIQPDGTTEGENSGDSIIAGGYLSRLIIRNNLISNARQKGVTIYDYQSPTTSTGHIIENNLFGTLADGLTPATQNGNLLQVWATTGAIVRHNIGGGATLDPAIQFIDNVSLDVSDNYLGLNINQGNMGNAGKSIVSNNDKASTVEGNIIANSADIGLYANNSSSNPADTTNIVNNTVYGNGYDGVTAYGNFIISSNTIHHNMWIGLTSSGAIIDSNIIHDNSWLGISDNGSTIENNTVYSNGRHGIYSTSGSTVNNASYGNNGYGISAYDSIIDNNTSHDNNWGGIYGDYSTIENNTTYDNTQAGIDVYDSMVLNNTSYNNDSGIYIMDYSLAQNNTVYGNNDGISVGGDENTVQDNIISDSQGDAVSVWGSDNEVLSNIIYNNSGDGIGIGEAYYTVISGNKIGLDQSNSLAGNSGHGIRVDTESHDTLIGGNTPVDRNYIASNGGDGVRVINIDYDHRCYTNTSSIITGNYIGTNIGGEIQAGYGNGGSGITVNEEEGSGRPCWMSVFKHQIGGDNPGEQNIIAGNREDGIRIFMVDPGVANTDVFGVSVLPNSIFGNGKMGINLAKDSTNSGTADTDLGPNPLNNYLMSYPAINANYYLNRPTINTVSVLGNDVTVNYSFQANGVVDNLPYIQASDLIGYRLDFYLNDSGQDGAYAGYSQGKTHLGHFFVDGSETGATHTFSSPITPTNSQVVTATATTVWKTIDYSECAGGATHYGDGPPYISCI